SVSYANLSPGAYTFRVRGTNSDGVWNNEGTSLKIFIKPPFWQTPWFFSIVGLILILAIAFTLRYQVRTKIRRSVEIEKIRLRESEKVRKQVAEDFHDELGHKLTHISLFTEIVKRNLQSKEPENRVYLEKIGETAKNLANGITNFIWTLDPEQDSLYDVALYMKDFGDEIFSKTGVHFWAKELAPNLAKIKIPMHWRRHITLLFKEAMHNTLKHAECRNVSFEVKTNRDYFDLILSDDGKGFDCELYTPEKGLRNMRNRALKLKCKFRLKSNPGEGTVISFKGHIM
ncbi:MAG: triple tyrosine motif-containing protein, partial [bacterium]